MLQEFKYHPTTEKDLEFLSSAILHIRPQNPPRELNKKST
jgi:hypothetical protein